MRGDRGMVMGKSMIAAIPIGAIVKAKTGYLTELPITSPIMIYCSFLQQPLLL
jgi:hypothetical protein